MKDEGKAPNAAMRVVVSENGPYFVYGGVPLSVQVIVPNEQGSSWDWREGKKLETKPEAHLCRCGHSNNKPFCDGSHAKVGFDGEETASRVPFARQAETIDGPTLNLSDAEELCAWARFCDAGAKIWNMIEKTDDPKVRELAIREANHCPSGRLVVHDAKTRKAIEDPLPPSIGVVEDPDGGCSGPLWVRGGITVESANGKPYEKRNRVTLCRCGASDNKPFCNGSHASVKFKDPFLEQETR